MPDAVVPIILGKGGAITREIQERSGARIRVSQKGEYVPGLYALHSRMYQYLVCVLCAGVYVRGCHLYGYMDMNMNLGSTYVPESGGAGDGVSRCVANVYTPACVAT